MLRADEFAEVSSLVREQVWLELCQSVFDSLLDGYAKAKKISTEGRASMSMDASMLHTALDQIHTCRPPRGKLHVDNFLRATYLSEDELLEWIRNNWQNYCYRHIYGLLTQVLAASTIKKKKFNQAIALLDSFYDGRYIRERYGGLNILLRASDFSSTLFQIFDYICLNGYIFIEIISLSQSIKSMCDSWESSITIFISGGSSGVVGGVGTSTSSSVGGVTNSIEESMKDFTRNGDFSKLLFG